MILAGTPAEATGLSTLSVRGTPVSGPARADSMAAIENPALLVGAGNGMVWEGGASRYSLAVRTDRHEGVDPNTGSPYALAQSEVTHPTYLAAVSRVALRGRVGVGVGLSQPIRYSLRTAEEGAPPSKSPQRYSAVEANIQSTAIGAGVGVQLLEGVHLGGSGILFLDKLSLIQAWDVMGTEGMGPDDEVAGQLNPYTGDAIYLYSGAGWHLGGSLGVFVDRWERVHAGVQWIAMGSFQTQGPGRLEVPELLGGVNIPLLASTEMTLPHAIRGGLLLQPVGSVLASLQVDRVLWGGCCGGRSGDVHAQVLHQDGTTVGPEDGIDVDLPPDQYMPRRLENTWALQAGVLASIGEQNRLGGSARWQQSAVPEFAVSAVNLDMTTWCLSAYADHAWQGLTLGLAARHVLVPNRVVDESGWDVRDTSLSEDSGFVDERFSPQFPFAASTNGRYSVSLNSVALRLEVRR